RVVPAAGTRCAAISARPGSAAVRTRSTGFPARRRTPRVQPRNEGMCVDLSAAIRCAPVLRERRQGPSLDPLGHLPRDIGWKRDTKCLGCLEIYDEVELRRLLDGKVAGPRPAQNAIYVVRGTNPVGQQVRPI